MKILEGLKPLFYYCIAVLQNFSWGIVPKCLMEPFIGELVKELKTSYKIKSIYPIGNNYVGSVFDKKQKSINFYDSDFNIVKNIYKGPDQRQPKLGTGDN